MLMMIAVICWVAVILLLRSCFFLYILCLACYRHHVMMIILCNSICWNTCLGWKAASSPVLQSVRCCLGLRVDSRGDKPSWRRRPTTALSRLTSRGEPGHDADPDALTTVAAAWSSATIARRRRPAIGDFNLCNSAVSLIRSPVLAQWQRPAPWPTVSDHQSPSSCTLDFTASVDGRRSALRLRQLATRWLPSEPGQHIDVVIIGWCQSSSGNGSSAVASSLLTRRYSGAEGRWCSLSQARWTRSNMTTRSTSQLKRD